MEGKKDVGRARDRVPIKADVLGGPQALTGVFGGSLKTLIAST